jgi:serine/threonine protein kinase
VPGADAESSLVGSTKRSDFEILREIGRGGQSIVYEAQQLSLRRKVALKRLPSAAVFDQRWLARFRESWKGIQEILFPCPGHDRPEVFAGLVGSATGIGTTLRDGTLVHPVEKLADLLATDLFESHSFAPLLPFLHGGRVCVPSSLGRCPCTKVIGHHSFEIRRHLPSSSAAGVCSNARSSRPVASR